MSAMSDFVYQPIEDEDGRVTGIFVDGHDVTAQKGSRNRSVKQRRTS